MLILFSFKVYAIDREVTLTWEANSEPDLSHYIVYWGVEPGVYTYNSGNIGLVIEYIARIPDDDQIYFFAVTAVDTSGLESDFSNEVNTGSVVFSLKSGWNLISIPDISENISVVEAFGPIMSSIINIWSYENGTLRAYPSYPGYGTFTVIKPWQGLWLNMRNSETIAFMPKTFNSIYLAKGWNLVRFALPESQDIHDAISKIHGNIISIWTYQEGRWLVYDPLNPYLSDLQKMDPGPGYWINVKNACVWTH
ncbi:MAG: hypothetical protein JW927_07075 [Deltaproteobacteria bacterium]|nr:hypothetical protein [Deltaproteobacteria bacterium]